MTARAEGLVSDILPRVIDLVREVYGTEWEALLARERVVLVCFCPVAAYCHRTIAAGFLASPRLGAVHEGEIGAAT